MKILQVVSDLQKASGVTTFVENVTEGLIALGREVIIAKNVDYVGYPG